MEESAEESVRESKRVDSMSCAWGERDRAGYGLTESVVARIG